MTQKSMTFTAADVQLQIDDYAFNGSSGIDVRLLEMLQAYRDSLIQAEALSAFRQKLKETEERERDYARKIKVFDPDGADIAFARADGMRQALREFDRLGLGENNV